MQVQCILNIRLGTLELCFDKLHLVTYICFDQLCLQNGPLANCFADLFPHCFLAQNGCLLSVYNKTICSDPILFLLVYMYSLFLKK